MTVKPLAERMRPTDLKEYIGQEHIIGEEGSLLKVLRAGVIPSMILWGPPGVGKTTLAYLIAKFLDRKIHLVSAINSGVKEVREVIKQAGATDMFRQQTPILFIDEIHRFSKSQQDSLLSAVEKGDVILIGATTENPSFEVISALLSRCQVYTLRHLEREELELILSQALEKDSVLKRKNIVVEETEALIRYSGGDARKLMNLLELVVNSGTEDKIIINNDMVSKNLQDQLYLYDKNGEMHYDVISAFIKSIRGSDPNAAVYWLARMVEGGEDVKFIARRLIILAAEDIGNANPTALIMANNCFQAVQVIGFPESRIILSQCAVYLANSSKSNASYEAIRQAQKEVKKSGHQPVPLHLRNAPTKLMKELGYGDNYQYAHNYEQNFVVQEFLPEKISGTVFYKPGNNAKEQQWKEQLKSRWKGKYNYD
jgi:putative ATPase